MDPNRTNVVEDDVYSQIGEFDGYPNYLLYTTNGEYKNEVDEILSMFTSQEIKVIHYILGLTDGVRHNLLECSKVCGTSREYNRQILARSLRYLRHPNAMRRLYKFYKDK
jgi:DNA-directed RNA polymerase sigma subunit (sigma70/sigma32)